MNANYFLFDNSKNEDDIRIYRICGKSGLKKLLIEKRYLKTRMSLSSTSASHQIPEIPKPQLSHLCEGQSKLQSMRKTHGVTEVAYERGEKEYKTLTWTIMSPRKVTTIDAKDQGRKRD